MRDDVLALVRRLIDGAITDAEFLAEAAKLRPKPSEESFFEAYRQIKAE